VQPTSVRQFDFKHPHEVLDLLSGKVEQRLPNRLIGPGEHFSFETFLG
jgi:hypothetical protein